MADDRLPFSRWWLVAVAALAMGAAGTYQFTWSSIRIPLGNQIGAPEAALGTVFTVYIIFQTLSQFPAGWVRDRYGPRLPILVGAPLVCIGYAGVAMATTPITATIAYGVGGVGAGITYTVAINTPVKWFDQKRGLATGITTATYGGMSFFAIPSLRTGLQTDYQGTLLLLAAFTGLAVIIGASVFRDPPRQEEDDQTATQESDPTVPDAFTWNQAVRTWQFWLLYVVLIVVNGVGLMLIGKVVSLAGALGISHTIATVSASLIALGDAAGLVIVGAISDRVGGVRTVAVSLTLSGLSIAGVVVAGAAAGGLVFIAAVTAAAFFRSPAFVIIPGIVGDYYGTRFSSEVYAALYTAKLWGGVLGGVGASVLISHLDWAPTFALGALLLVGAGLSSHWLRPVERNR